MMIDPFVLLAATLPLIGYCLLLAVVRVSGRTLVTTGGRDLAAVLVAVAGFVMVGPAELFFPHGTATLLGAWVWFPLALLYLLVGTLAVLTSRPRLVVYGRTSEELYPAVLRAAKSIDGDATGDVEQWQVHLPAKKIDLRLDGPPGHDCLTVESFQASLPPAFWDQLLSALRTESRATLPPPRRRGWWMLAGTVIVLGLIAQYAVAHPAALAAGFRQWLVR